MADSYYSPYETDTFQRCPTEWSLKKRWQPKRNPNYSTLIGTAVAKALELFFKGMDAQALDVANTIVTQGYEPGGQQSLKGVLGLVKKGYDLGTATRFDLDTIEAVEVFFGRTKPDLVIRNKAGNLVVVDHKVKLNLDPRYLEKELLTYDTSNQLYTYAWQVGSTYGEPVTETIIHMIILGPDGQTVLHPVRITEEHLAHWRQGVGKTWEAMNAVKAGGSPEARYSQCIGKYGKCDMYDLCHILHGDESKAGTLYDAYKPNW